MHKYAHFFHASMIAHLPQLVFGVYYAATMATLGASYMDMETVVHGHFVHSFIQSMGECLNRKQSETLKLFFYIVFMNGSNYFFFVPGCKV